MVVFGAKNGRKAAFFGPKSGTNPVFMRCGIQDVDVSFDISDELIDSQWLYS